MPGKGGSKGGGSGSKSSASGGNKVLLGVEGKPIIILVVGVFTTQVGVLLLVRLLSSMRATAQCQNGR